MQEHTGVAGRTALVTGGSQGIGRCIALALGRAGARVGVVASSSQAKADAVAAEIIAAGGVAIGAVANVADRGAVDGLVRNVAGRLGPIEILVNSAGVFYPTPAGATSAADVDRMVAINFKGIVNTIECVVPGMRERRYGRIVNVASIAGQLGFAGFSVYCATKAAVLLLTRALACELAPEGIRINALAPGNVRTPMNEAIRTDPGLKSIVDSMQAMTPSGVTFSEPEEIAALALALVSNLANALHGSVLVADQGVSAGHR